MIVRFFIGLCFGVILTVCSFGFVGVGHGTYVPMAFSGSVVAVITVFGAIPGIVLTPFLWALYFLLIPRLKTRRARITLASIVLSFHIVIGTALAIEDPAFQRAVNAQPGQFLMFGLIWMAAMCLLFHFAVRESNKDPRNE